MLRKRLHATAEIFREETKIPIGPVAIDDSPWGFLLEWWSIFSDMYFTRQSSREVQQALSEAPLFHPYNQEHCSQFLETGSSSKEPWLETQNLQPSMTLSRASPFNLSDNIFLHDYPIRHIQQNKPEYHLAHRFASLDEKWVKQSNFLIGGKEDEQSTSIRRKAPSNSVTHLNEHVHHSEIESPNQTNFVSPKLVGSHPTELYTTPNVKMPTIGFHDTGIHLNANKNKLSGWPLTGIGSSSINIEHQGLGPFFMPPNQVQQLQPFWETMHPMQGSRAPIMGNHSQPITGNSSDQIGSSTQKDKEKAMESVENEKMERLVQKNQLMGEQFEQNTRKRKEPSHSGSEEKSGNGDSAGPSKITSPSQEASSSRTLTESYGEAAQAEISKPMDALINVNEGSREDNVESLPSTGEAGNENNGDNHSSMVQQGTLDENKV